MKAPLFVYDLPAGLEWVNTDTPPKLSTLRGRATLLWFFTGSCGHCRDEFADLKVLESRYADGLSIIGVHQPRYPVESASARVLKTLNRWFCKFPVINDREFELWRLFGVTTWPTAVLLDAEGKLLGSFPGAGRRNELDSRIKALLDDATKRELRLQEAAPRASRPEPRGTLSFPTGVAATDQYVYVAESGRNRILELTHEGRVLRVFGSGNAGLWDGKLAEAGFNAPQGLALGREALYVADTGNHALRRVKLISGDVETLAGTGKRAQGAIDRSSPARSTALSSPVGLAYAQEKVYISMAGQHQLWVYDVQAHTLSHWLGNGREDLVDGFGDFASFGQPAGLSMGRESLYVADAGSNSVRAVRLADGSVSSLIEGQLFEYGDQDGGANARVAGPKAVCMDPTRNVLWIADSMNGKLRLHALAKAETKTLNLNYPLDDHSGLALGGGNLWLANTNAHELLRLDLKTGKLLRVGIVEPAHNQQLA